MEFENVKNLEVEKEVKILQFKSSVVFLKSFGIAEVIVLKMI